MLVYPVHHHHPSILHTLLQTTSLKF